MLTDLRARFLGHKLSPIWAISVRIYEDLRVHADGDVPIKLIRTARPNESEAVHRYREAIYESETQNPVERVLGILEKIRRSPDWMVRFDDGIVPPIINAEETLEKYLTEKYPTYNHIEDWLFQEVLKNLAIDANSVIVVMPEMLNISPTEYLRPTGQVYNSRNVLDYVPGEFALVRSDEYSSLLNEEERNRRIIAEDAIRSIKTVDRYTNAYVETFKLGQVYYYIDALAYYKFEENPSGDYVLTERLVHGIGELPVFQMPGKFIRRTGSSILKKTLLYAMVPHLNKAARESSDLDAGVTMHLYPEKWRINNMPCPKCNGTAKEQTLTGPIPCRECKGTGVTTGKSPFNEIIVKPSALGDATIPIPPVGYVEKKTDIIELQNTRIEQHIYKALSAVNMEHLAESPHRQSGVSKMYDRDEVNNLIYAFAGDLVTVFQNVVRLVCELRYRDVVPSPEARRAMLPIIPIPEKFDIINTSFLLGEYQVGKTAGLNDIILTEMQKEISQKKFYSNPKVAEYVQTVMECDPFPTNTVDEKALMQAQGLATKEDIILSNYISDFVQQAMEDNPEFGKKKNAEKRAILLAMAAKKVTSLSTAAQLSQDIFAIPGAGKQPGAPPLTGQDNPAQKQENPNPAPQPQRP